MSGFSSKSRHHNQPNSPVKALDVNSPLPRHAPGGAGSVQGLGPGCLAGSAGLPFLFPFSSEVDAMFGWFNRSRRRPAGAPPRRVRLTLERLETRFCPAAPVLSGLTAQTGPGHEVYILGQVQDESPGSV